MGKYLAGFIGCGNMGGALCAVAAKRAGGGSILTADHNESKLQRLHGEYGTVPSTAKEIAEKCPLIVLGVKPQVMAAAAEEIRDILARRGNGCTVVSMAAGMTAETVSGLLGGNPVIRIMPNTPAAVGQGVILYCLGKEVTEEAERALLDLLSPAGTMLRLDEGKIDAGSAVSGCGPAFVCMFAEALTDGGVRCGLTREQASRLALQTIAGSALLAMETGTDPALLRAQVCSPAGSTIEGVAALEERAFRAAVMEAVAAAYRRTKELG